MSNEIKNQIEENKLEESSSFVVDDSSKAMWAINKVKELRAERDFYIDACKKEIERLKEEIVKEEEKCDRQSNYFIFQLNAYMDREDVPSKETKTQVSLKLPNGKIVRKLAKAEIVDNNGNTGSKIKDNPSLIDFVGEEYIKTTKTVDWAEYKKTLTIDGDVVIDSNGEIVDCLGVQETLPSVDIKIEE